MTSLDRIQGKISTSEWKHLLHSFSKNIADSLEDSVFDRSHAEEDVISSQNSTKYGYEKTNYELAFKITILRDMYSRLESAKANLLDYIRKLKNAKIYTENFLLTLNDAVDTNLKCLVIREGRFNNELVDDEVLKELQVEKNFIEHIMKDLREAISISFERLKLMTDCQLSFVPIMQDNEESILIDCNELDHNKFSPNGFRPDLVSNKPLKLDFVLWKCNIEETIHKSVNNIDIARELINNLHYLVHSSSDRLDVQSNRVALQLRIRIHDLEVAIGELEFRKKQLNSELRKSEEAISLSQVEKIDQISFLQLAETRRHNRLMRPEEENGLDMAQISLNEEQRNITQNKDLLESRLSDLMSRRAELLDNLHQVKSEIEVKRKALGLEENVSEIRQRLHYPLLTNQMPCDSTAKPTMIRRTRTNFY